MQGRLRLAVLALISVVGLLVPTAAQAAADHVTNSGDSGSAGQLRQVIAGAASGDTVVIDPGVNPSLVNGEIVINQNLTIAGQGARSTTINANSKSRIFDIDPNFSSHPTVTIEDLTLTGGAAPTDSFGFARGGAVTQSDGTLALTDVALSGNKATGPSGGGGAALLSGIATLDGVTVTGNSATSTCSGCQAPGGGILIVGAGSVTVINSTIAGNTASDTVGASLGQGGGIFSVNGLTLISSTVDNNQALTSSQSGSTAQGGNLFVTGAALALRNTIVAGGTITTGGTASSGSNCFTNGLSISDGGHNLESTSPSQCGLTSASPDFDLIGSGPAFATTAPANNGGPTDTLALMSASPGVDYVPVADCTDASGKSPLTVDQRGAPRRDAGESTCDIGAYELQDTPPMWVANFNSNALNLYPANAAGNVAPTATISGSNTGLAAPDGVARDPAGDLFVTNFSGSSVSEFAPGASGNAAPAATISGSSTQLNHPADVALDSRGDLWVANDGGNSVLEFAPGASGNAPPTITISGSSTGLSSPFSIAVNSSGDVFVVNHGTPSVTEYAPGASGNAAPISTISGSNTGFNQPNRIALDTSGNLFLVNFGTNAVLQFAAGASGNATPSRTISGGNTHINGPLGLAVDPAGGVYVSNSAGSGSIAEFAAGSVGNASPSATISGSSTQLDVPQGIALVVAPPPPKVTGLSPHAGAVAGGNTVTITGTNFLPGATVTFGSTAASSVTFVSPTKLSVRAPAQAAGTVSVTVSTPGGTSATSTADLYAYGPPTVPTFTPSSGITGSKVTITGTGFAPGVRVLFGSLSSPAVIVASGTQLKAVVPNGAVAGKISVSDTQGTATSAGNFTPTLSITSFSPISGPPGAIVTINGIGFNSSSTVKFNGTSSAMVTHVSSSKLMATVPTGASTGPITVTNSTSPTGTVRSAASFAVT